MLRYDYPAVVVGDCDRPNLRGTMSAFALDLDHDGIRLLQRQDGDWVILDTVALEDPDLPTRMRSLRDLAAERSDGPLETDLIIPPSQILYRVLPDPPEDTSRIDAFVADVLTTLTICPVEDLVFDWRRVAAGIAVAALEINTLDEAEGFANTYDFNPVRFTARPGPDEFPDIPDFGPTEAARHAASNSATPVFATARSETEPAPIATEAAQTENIFAPDFKEGAEPELTLRQPETSARAVVPPAARGAARPASRPASRPPRGRWGILAAIAGGGALALATLVWVAVTLIAPGGGTQMAYTPGMPEGAEAAPGLARLSALTVIDDDTGHAQLAALDPDSVIATPEQMRGRAGLVSAGPDSLADAREMPDPSALTSADIWQTPPPPPPDPVGETLDTLYLASIDPVIQPDDAFALFAALPDQNPPQAPPPPPDAAVVFDLDERGLVIATPEGALTPDGLIVTLGRPQLTPPDRPATAVAAPDPEVALALAGKQPRARPSDLIERMERARLGGRTLTELATIRARERPESAQEVAIAAAETSRPSPLAVEVSRAPSSRPSDFGAIVEAVRRQQATETPGTTPAAAVAALVPVQPSIPSSASVARQATIENAINLRQLNLIGVYGSDGQRRALVRLPSGRYQKVEVGDRLDGGRIAAIGDNELRYVKGGRNVVLRVPSG